MTEYKYKHYTIDIDYGRDNLLPEFTLATLKERYLLPNERSPQEAFARAAEAFADDAEHAQRMYDYASKLWFGFSTPVLANAGTKRGLPISCFLQSVDDSIDGLVDNIAESIYLTVNGGGLGSYWGNIRSDKEPTSHGSSTGGSLPFLHTVDSLMLGYRQGKTRRGSCAVYQDVSHPEIEEFLDMRKAHGGDINRKCLNLHHAVNITDDFMYAVEADAEWDLIDPHSKRVAKTVKARELWFKILEIRHETGEPYLHFIDTTNRNRPQWVKDKGMKITQSNLCSEILLPTGIDYNGKNRTAVCCLSSVNVEAYDEWRGTEMVADIVRYLDNVISGFIKRACEISGMEDAVYSARMERSLGLGAMGFHSYLQSKNIPFESAMAMSWNKRIFKEIQDDAIQASEQLAIERGEPNDTAGTGRRNSYLLAIAPNASSSIICGLTSAGIEPWSANSFTQKTLSGSFNVRNKFLDALIKERTSDAEEYDNVWSSITANDGSVQHLAILSNDEKDVFKTAHEISQHWVVKHAADRQEFIDQGQSLNIFVASDIDKAEFHDIHWNAWKQGIRTMYYCRSGEARKAETINKDACLGCAN